LITMLDASCLLVELLSSFLPLSSKNDSLHGYNIYDPKEQDMNPPLSVPQSSRSSAGGSDVSMSRLPPPPVRLGSKPSFKCDICGQTIWVTRKRDWK
jgi:hypothetical protein